MSKPKRKCRNNKKRKGKISISQSVRLKPTTQMSNVGNIGHATMLANTGVIKVKIRKKA